jgi:PAS domain S-box-containing protein
VIEGMEDGVIVVDAEGRIVDVNPAASRILGLPESKAVGTDASGNVPGWNESGRSEVSLGEGEARRDFEVSVSSLSGKRGNLAGSVVVLRDVTVRRRAERALRESELRLGAVVRNAPVVLFGLDSAGRFTFSEGKGLEALGLEPGEVVGKSVFEVYGEVPEIIDHVRRALGGEELSAVADVGGIRFETRYSPLFDDSGEVSGVIGISLDVTERERAEAERERRSEELHRSNAELEQFSYSVSHDLRAPLRSIDGFSQILVEDYSDSLDESAKHYLGRVRSASQRMGELIDDLLELSRINRIEMRWETVDMSRIAGEVAENLRSREPERDVRLDIAPNLLAQGNPRLLKLALENLIDNAWKFTSKNEGGATIKFGREGDAFFVRDDGAGFEMEYSHKLFGAFQRLHDSEEFEGTGVGLATVARIIHRHGGEVWAEGEVGKGATFFFTL